MDFKKWWKKLKYWQKGGVVGVLFGLIIIGINFVHLIGIINVPILYKLSGLLMMPSVYISFYMYRNCDNLGCLMVVYLIFFLVPVLYGLMGALIGLIVKKIKNKKN